MIRWFKNTAISKKLAVGFALVTVLGIITGIIGMINLVAIRNAEQGLFEENTQSIRYIASATEKLMVLRVNARDLYIYADKDRTDIYKTIEDTVVGIDNDLALLKQVISEDEFTQFDMLSSAYDSYKVVVNDIVDVAKSKVGADILLDTIAAGKTAGNDTQNAFESFSEMMAEQAEKQIKADETLATIIIIAMGGVILISIVLSLIFSTFISRIIGKPLKKIAEASSMLAVGNLDIDQVFDEKDKQLKNQKDEIGKLALSFDQLVVSTREQARTAVLLADGDLTVDFTVRSSEDAMGRSLSELATRLRGLIQSIVASANQVTDGSKLVATSSMQLSDGANRQASGIEEVTVAVNEISRQAQITSENVNKANALVNETKQTTAFESKQMQEMTLAMEKINLCANGVYKIIKVIDDIAFQTNILALNAAVEAARAGQAGKGFAVVAEEVRALANKSTIAVKESTELIQNSINSVKTGTVIAEDTTKSLNNILEKISKTAELTSSITQSITEQTDSIVQIDQALAQVSQAVQTVAATAEESAAASEELSGQAEQLYQNVSFFKTDNNNIEDYETLARKNTRAVSPIELGRRLLKYG